jgi:hypothetical protein
VQVAVILQASAVAPPGGAALPAAAPPPAPPQLFGRGAATAAAAPAAAAPAAPAALPDAGTVVNIIELLCFCVRHHSYRIKYYILRNNVVDKVLRLTRRRERFLVVAAIRFLRTCVDLKDDFYHRCDALSRARDTCGERVCHARAIFRDALSRGGR